MIVTSAKKKRKTASAVLSISAFIRITPVAKPSQESRYRHPGELIPVEKRKAEECRVMKIVKRDPKKADEGEQEQPKTMSSHRRATLCIASRQSATSGSPI
jgi:hypothetical protein